MFKTKYVKWWFDTLSVSQAKGILTLEVIILTPNHILTPNDVAIT